MTRSTRARRTSHPFPAALGAALLLLATLAGPPAGADSFDDPVWKPLGPAPIDEVEWSGRIADLAVSPTRPDVYLAGAASGGPWLTDSGGEAWRSAGAGLPTTAIGSVVIDPHDERILYAGSGEGHHAYHSLYGLGLYRSTDAGRTWEVLGGETFAGRTITRIRVAPDRPGTLWVTVGRAGGTDDGLEGAKLHPRREGPTGLFRSDDGGETWTFRYPGNIHGLQSHYNSALAVHPDDPEILFLGGVRMVRTTDAGDTWTNVTPPHLDVHQIVFDAAGRLLAATDGGVYRSEDLGDSWEPLNRHLGTIQLYPGLSVDPHDRRRLLGGTQDNGTVLSDASGRSWRWIFGGDGGYTAFHPHDPDLLFVQFQGAGNLFRSDDGGLSFEKLDLPTDFPLDSTAFQAPFQLDPNDPDRILYGTRRIWENTDRGDTWAPISGDLTEVDPTFDLSAIRSLAIAPSNGSTVYATTNNQRLLVSTDGGVTWELVRQDLYHWPRIARQIAVDPVDDATAYVAEARFGGDRVLVTRDRGQTWSPIGAGLPNRPVNTVAVHREGDRRIVLAGTDRGVWATADGGATWTRYGKRLPAVPVMDLRIDPRHRRLVAATLGRGVWEAGLVE